MCVDSYCAVALTESFTVLMIQQQLAHASVADTCTVGADSILVLGVWSAYQVSWSLRGCRGFGVLLLI
jgi:hypothetical protein